MRLAFLPNWCKWLSLALIIAAFIIDIDNLKSAFMEGYHARQGLYEWSNDSQPQKTTNNVATPSYTDLIIFLSIIVFILSKDKRDDDYYNLIRAKALLLALLLSTFVLIIVFLFNRELDGFSLLLIHFLFYITIFKILKIREDFATNDLD